MKNMKNHFLAGLLAAGCAAAGCAQGGFDGPAGPLAGPVQLMEQ